MNSMTLKSVLRLINVLVLVILLLVIGVGVLGLRQVSNSANRMGIGKDVVADILPPPLFLIEAQLTLYDIAAASAKDRSALLVKLEQLRKDYNDRNAFWTELEFDHQVKSSLLGEQKTRGDQFWQEVDKSFLPALHEGNEPKMLESLRTIREHFDAHKKGVEATVVVGSKFAENTLADLTASSQTDTWLMAVAGAIGVLVIFFSIRSLTNWLLSRLGGEPAEVVQAVGRIAEGDLSGRIELLPEDNGSIVFAMKQMQDRLGLLVSEIRDLVAAAEKGDLSKRIALSGKQGFGRDISEALNQLVDVTDTSLRDISTVSVALASGDLSQTVTAQYPGAFGQTASAVNRTVAGLNSVVEEVRSVVNAAAEGDFSKQIDAGQKRGYEKTLAELLNRLCVTANEALTDISRVAQSLAAGDLTSKIDRRYPGLFGDTSQGINETVGNLQHLIGNVVGAASTIGRATLEISAGNKDLSVRTEEQASNLEETAASMEEFASMVQQNTDSAKQASILAREASEVAQRGGEVVKATVSTMGEIQQSSKRVGDIIGVIDGIAFQTNILALNAAVEAARAGEQGRGFAVVASEVRSLAQRSASAAKEIANLIAASVGSVEQGSAQAREAGETMERIVSSINRVTEIVASISNASQEQSVGIQQVTQAVTQMDDVTQRNAALVEQASAAAESLAQQAADLQDQVATFRLEDVPHQGAVAPVIKPRAVSEEEDEWATF